MSRSIAPPDRLPVFYRPEQSALHVSYSPSAGKPAQVMADWLADPELAVRIDVRSFEPVTRDDLALAHSRAYVDGVLDCTRDNGFRDRSPTVAAALPYTVGSMVAAAQHAAREHTFACSPTSGFHHAHFAEGGGFCTFNGLMVAARMLILHNVAEKVAILDLDHHYGDGTADILERRPALARLVLHETVGAHGFAKVTGRNAVFERWVRQRLRAFADAGAGVALYQAGADMHAEDPLGGLLDDVGMAGRDCAVFAWAGEYGLPVAWNLAGGYRKDASGGIGPVLDTHRATLRACLGLGNEYPAPGDAGD